MVNRMFKNTTDALLYIRVSSNLDLNYLNGYRAKTL